MLTANEYLANIYQVLVKIDDKLSRQPDSVKDTSSKAATQGMGFSLGGLVNKKSISDLKELGVVLKEVAGGKAAVESIDTLSNSLKSLSSGLWKFWLVPKAAKNALLEFIQALAGSRKGGGASQIAGAASDITGLSIALKRMSADPKKISETAEVLSKLFKVLSNFGKKEKEIKNITNMADSLSKAFKEVNQVAKNMAILFLGIGGAILIIAGSLFLAGQMLGKIGPVAVLGVVTLTILTITGIFWLLTKVSGKVKEGAITGKEMGKALMWLAGGVLAFVVSWQLIARIMKVGEDAKGLAIAAGVIVGIIGVFAGIFWLLGTKIAQNVKDGAQTAKAMGVGLIFLAGGLLAMAGIAWLFSKLDNPIKAVTTIALITGALVGIFYLMGKFWKQMLIGTGVMLAFSFGVYVLSLALKPILDIANMIEKLKTPGKTLATLGLAVAALIGIFAIVGIPAVAAFVALGAAVISAMVLPFLILSKTLINFATATKQFMEIAKTYKIEDIKPTVSGLIEGVLGGFAQGFKKALGGGKTGIAAVLEATKNSVVIFAGIGLLMGVSVALSQFAKALTAFADLGNMRVIEGTDKDGKPIFGEKIDVRAVGATMADTISSFLTSLIASTSTLTKQQGPAIRKMARALTGRRGMLTAVIGFAEAIKTYAEFGKGNVIGVELQETNQIDPDTGNPIYKEVKTSVPIDIVVTNMVSSFSTFISALADNVDNFAKLASGGPFSPVKRVARMLTGRRGILAGVIGFAEALKMYSQFGKDNMIPMLDADGQPVLDANKKPITIPMTTVANNIVSSLSTFSEVLAGALDKEDKKNARQARGTLKKFDDLIEQFNKLATAQEGLAKVSATIGLLAQNIGLLSTNLNSIDPNKMVALTNIAKEGTKITDKAVRINSSGYNTVNYNTTNISSPAEIAKEKEQQKTKEPDWDKIAQMIGNQVGAQLSTALKSGQIKFEFSHDKSGVVTFN